MLYNPNWNDGIAPSVPNLSMPSIPNLIYILRHRETWPTNFVWFYPHPRFCAIGLSRCFWGSWVNSPSNPMTGKMYKKIFCSTSGKKKPFLYFFSRQPTMFEVTPEMVADQLEAEYA